MAVFNDTDPLSPGRIMNCHPLTIIILALDCTIVAVFLPSDMSLLFCACWFTATMLLPSRTNTRMTTVFLNVLVAAAMFLFLIHAVHWFPPEIDIKGLRTVTDSFVRIAIPVSCVFFLSRRVTSEELYSLLIDCRVPPPVIHVLFRTLWLAPRLVERTDEVVTALKLRGMRIDTPFQRMKALVPALSTIFSSMVNDISENALSLTARGFLREGRKSHFLKLTFGSRDVLIIVIATFTASLAVLWCCMLTA